VTAPAGQFPATDYPARLTAWLARTSSSGGVSLGLVAAMAAIDHLSHWQLLPFLPRGLVDEPCHFATAMIVLGALVRWRGRPPSRWFVRAMLISAVAIDLDHLPQEFGSALLTAGTPRPYTHALWLVVLLTGIALAAGRRARAAGTPTAATVTAIAAGAALGLAAHFLRDIVTAPISLWWPLSSAGVQLPYGWYLVALLILVALPVRRRTTAAAGGH
jgi:inner membrane protein